jgi:serine/threonine protein kinase
MNAIEIAQGTQGMTTLAQLEFGGMNPGLHVQWLIILAAFAVTAIIMLVMARWVIWPAFKGIGWFIGATFSFIGRTLRDFFKLIGALLTIVVFIPLVVGSLVIGRWSASNHFANSLKGELGLAGKCVYRLVAANFLTSFGMRDVVAGIEERIPQALADAPGSDLPHLAEKRGFIFEAEMGLGSKAKERAGVFDGYKIVGSLPGGGSGGKLYIADPDAIKVATYERNGHFGVGQVVIKSFSIRDGSSLPQIVRESQSLPAAKKLGLVLDHELTPERFFYVMRYVPGQSLSAVTHQLHAGSAPPNGEKGLDDASLRTALGLVADLVATLDAYHRGGLWHKDVKPDNIIVDGKRAHLVDFGLVTPLRSAMTLTTHGTEYFRDPEMVRMALKGVKVHEVDGAKFDVFGAGAVLYSVIENSFPAHGALSQISMRCPEALRWIVRRAMTDYDKRYPTAGAMLRDLDAIRKATDPMAVKPGQLPSMQEGGFDEPMPLPEPMPMPVYAATPVRERAAGSPMPAAAAVVGAAAVGSARAGVPPVMPGSSKPKVRLTNWVTGAFEIEGGTQPPSSGTPAAPAEPRARRDQGARRSAAEQVVRARGRAAARRERARDRMSNRATSVPRAYSNNPNVGTYIAVGSVLFLASILTIAFVRNSNSEFVPSAMRMDPDSGMSVTITDRDPSGRERRTSNATSVIADGGVEVGPVPVHVAQAPAARVEGKVALVVVDLKKPLDAGHEKTIRACVARLREAGFEVRGEVPGGEPDDNDLELTASAIKAAGGLAVDTDNGSAAVGRWIAEEASGTDVVVWFKPRAGSRGEDPGLQAVVLGPLQGRVSNEDRADALRTVRAAREAIPN